MLPATVAGSKSSTLPLHIVVVALMLITGAGLTVTVNVKGLPSQSPAFGVIV
jgi:hypothetical protein